ncbi:hypothetical protein WDW86_07310 [Bdellovibrionota bacterium FG-2]
MITFKKMFFSGLILSAFMTGSAMADCRGTNDAVDKGDLPADEQAPQQKQVRSGTADDSSSKRGATPDAEAVSSVKPAHNH